MARNPSKAGERANDEIVVLTGSSGCLGHRTLRLLVNHDDQVREIRCLDLVEPSECMRASVEEDCRRLAARAPAIRKTIKYIKGDIRDINVAEQSLEGADCVIHCAGRVDLWSEPADQDACEIESTNAGGTENLLRACVRLGVPKFVYASSFETFVNYHTIYYATESTLPDPKWLLFGPSAESKKEAELKVRQYANNKLKRATIGCRGSGNSLRAAYPSGEPRDFLNAVIVRFTPIYGENDKHYVTRILKIAKFLSGKLQRFSNVWIRQQPIYVGNAAWALIKAKHRMDVDESISGEEFHVTDDTKIGDPFDFLEPFVECRGMHVTKSAFPAWPVWLLLIMFSYLRGILSTLDVFGLYSSKKSRLHEAIERDTKTRDGSSGQGEVESGGPTRWYHLVTPQIFYFMCNSLFLNRTKASLRLDYEPLFGAEESLKMSLDWYRDSLVI